jgi:hypothetical protein
MGRNKRAEGMLICIFLIVIMVLAVVCVSYVIYGRWWEQLFSFVEPKWSKLEIESISFNSHYGFGSNQIVLKSNNSGVISYVNSGSIYVTVKVVGTIPMIGTVSILDVSDNLFPIKPVFSIKPDKTSYQLTISSQSFYVIYNVCPIQNFTEPGTYNREIVIVDVYGKNLTYPFTITVID